jgi:metal-sulfur cluster biosynthetic enzyme
VIEGVKQVDVEMTFEPQWGMDMMSEEARLELGFM